MTAATLVRSLPEGLRLAKGSHSSAADGMCFMEAVSFVVEGDWTDAPPCVSRVIRNIGISMNDRWSDADRQLLVPFIPRVIGTRTTETDEEIRRLMAVDWLYRTAVPGALRLAKLDVHAEKLALLAPILTQADWVAARPLMWAARDAASERREASRASLRKKLAAAAADVAVAVAADVAVAVAADVDAAVAADVAVAAAADVDAISRALAGSASSGDEWSTRIANVVKPLIATLPKDASWMTIYNLVYWPVRAEVREMLNEGLSGSSEYEAYRIAMRDSSLEMLGRMIEVGQPA